MDESSSRERKQLRRHTRTKEATFLRRSRASGKAELVHLLKRHGTGGGLHDYTQRHCRHAFQSNHPGRWNLLRGEHKVSHSQAAVAVHVSEDSVPVSLGLASGSLHVSTYLVKRQVLLFTDGKIATQR